MFQKSLVHVASPFSNLPHDKQLHTFFPTSATFENLMHETMSALLHTGICKIKEHTNNMLFTQRRTNDRHASWLSGTQLEFPTVF